MVNTTTINLEDKPINELTRKELKQIAAIKMNEQKEQIKKDLKDIKTIYVSYLNNQGTEMLFYYINMDPERGAYLDKIWISSPTIWDDVNTEIIDLPFEDKPFSWKKSRSGQYYYCFRATGYGYSKSDHCLDSLYTWLYGYDFDLRNKPRIENLN